MPTIIVRCGTCDQKNRIAPTVQTKAIICGNKICGDPLATPAIVDRLFAVHDALLLIDREFDRFAPPSQHATLERQFRKQERILKSLPDYPGYRFTVRVSQDLVLEIEELVYELQRKLDKNVFVVARRALDAIIDYFRNGGPPQLLRGMGF